jgi:hypothetical protein
VVEKTSIAIQDCGSDGTSPSPKIASDSIRGFKVLGPSIYQQQPQVLSSKFFASTDSRVDTAEDVKFTGPNPCFFVFIRGSKIAPPQT